MRLLITRPMSDAATLQARLDRLGHQAVLSPVTEIVPRPFRPPDWADIAGLIFTSRNAIDAAAPFPATALALPVWTVGDATAAIAGRAGFTTLTSANGDVESLVAVLKTFVPPAGRALLHLRGEPARGDLAARLTALGIAVVERIVYEARAASALTPAAKDALEKAQLDGAILLSPRAARLVARLARQDDLAPALARLTAYCISDATAAEIAGVFGSVITAPRPDLVSLLGLIPRLSPPQGR